MKIVLLGANGRTGRLVLQQALAAGHTVTGLVRSTASLNDTQHDRLSVREGNVCDADFLKRVLPGHDAVVSTLGPRAISKSACRIYSDSAVAIVDAMQSAGIRRVLLTSTALLFPSSGLLDRVLRVIARNNQKAAGLMEAVIRDAGLEYTFARAGFLSDGDNPHFTATEGAPAQSGGSLSRLALANYLVTELEQTEHVSKVVGLCESSVASGSPVANFAATSTPN